VLRFCHETKPTPASLLVINICSNSTFCHGCSHCHCLCHMYADCTFRIKNVRSCDLSRTSCVQWQWDVRLLLTSFLVYGPQTHARTHYVQIVGCKRVVLFRPEAHRLLRLHSSIGSVMWRKQDVKMRGCACEVRLSPPRVCALACVCGCVCVRHTQPSISPFHSLCIPPTPPPFPPFCADLDLPLSLTLSLCPRMCVCVEKHAHFMF